jgi:hypothetical protein
MTASKRQQRRHSLHKTIEQNGKSGARIAAVEDLVRKVGTQQFRSITNSFLRTRNEKLEKYRGIGIEAQEEFRISRPKQAVQTRPR